MIDAYLLALLNTDCLGAKSLEKLFNYFKTGSDVWHASKTGLVSAGLTQKRADDLLLFISKNKPEKFLTLIEKTDIRIVFQTDSEYPSLLKTIYDPPFALFAKGSPLKPLNVAMVGSREATTYGTEVAFNFAKTISTANCSIVSGLATGIDSVAHEGALSSGGHTTAVLGGGHLTGLSMEKRKLADKILENGGTIISEFGLLAPYASFHFPMRNRIIAGMAQASVIIEAKLPSGSLITAKAAMEAGRDVFAVPGPINSPTSIGTNELIKDGALVAASPTDVLQLLGIEHTTSQPTKRPLIEKVVNVPEKLQVIYNCLSFEPTLTEDVINKTNKTSAEVSVLLLELELLGLIKSLPGQRYQKT